MGVGIKRFKKTLGRAKLGAMEDMRAEKRRVAPHRNDISGSNDEFTPSDYFMLSEYEHLTEMLLYTKEVGHKRVQFWLSIVTAAGGLLALLYQIDGGTATFFGTALIACLGLLVIGWTVFLKLIHRTVTTVEYLRGLGKIKHYFTENDSRIKRHLYFPARDDMPSFKYDPHMMGSSLRGLVVTINSFVIAALAAILPYFVWGGWAGVPIEIILGVAAFGISYLVHELYAIWRLGRAEHDNHFRVCFSRDD